MWVLWCPAVDIHLAMKLVERVMNLVMKHPQNWSLCLRNCFQLRTQHQRSGRCGMFRCSVLVLTVRITAMFLKVHKNTPAVHKYQLKQGLSYFSCVKQHHFVVVSAFGPVSLQTATATPHSQAYPVFRNLVCNHNSTHKWKSGKNKTWKAWQNSSCE